MDPLHDVEIDDVDNELEEVHKDHEEEEENGQEAKATEQRGPAVSFQRKDSSLKKFLESMDEYAPIIPDAVTDYYLAKSGFETNDKRIKRLLALATQKFISDIASDAYQYSRIRSASSVSSASNPQARARALMAGAQGSSAAAGSSMGPAISGQTSAANQGKLILTMEDLGSALAEYGLNVKRPDFYR